MQKNDITKLPQMNEGDAISLHLEITRVSNGFIVKGWKEGGQEDLMVFNGQESHRSVAGHALGLALSDMKQGEIIDFHSSMKYIKKI